VEPAVRVVLRPARRALDEETDVQIPSGGKSQLSGRGSKNIAASGALTGSVSRIKPAEQIFGKLFFFGSRAVLGFTLGEQRYFVEFSAGLSCRNPADIFDDRETVRRQNIYGSHEH
jgi:hypothetical protein